MAATDARRDAVVLSALQQRVARIVADLPEAEQFALAGGAALVLAEIVDRETRDLDFFGPSADDVDALADAVEAALVEAGLNVRRVRTLVSGAFDSPAPTDVCVKIVDQLVSASLHDQERIRDAGVDLDGNGDSCRGWEALLPAPSASPEESGQPEESLPLRVPPLPHPP